MTIIKKETVVAYTPEQMYTLVNNIEDYPNFLPWCQATTIISRHEDEVRATLHVMKGGIQHSFSTINRLQPHEMIEIRLLQGPFRHLAGCWKFESVPRGCRVSLDFEFVLANRLLDLAFGPVVQNIANTFIEAFCERAKAIYGES